MRTYLVAVAAESEEQVTQFLWKRTLITPIAQNERQTHDVHTMALVAWLPIW